MTDFDVEMDKLEARRAQQSRRDIAMSHRYGEDVEREVKKARAQQVSAGKQDEPGQPGQPDQPDQPGEATSQTYLDFSERVPGAELLSFVELRGQKPQEASDLPTLEIRVDDGLEDLAIVLGSYGIRRLRLFLEHYERLIEKAAQS
jgi:hypothetical protein